MESWLLKSAAFSQAVLISYQRILHTTVMDDVSKAEYQSRIKELQAFIQSQPKRLTFDDTLVKHLLARIVTANHTLTLIRH